MLTLKGELCRVFVLALFIAACLAAVMWIAHDARARARLAKTNSEAEVLKAIEEGWKLKRPDGVLKEYTNFIGKRKKVIYQKLTMVKGGEERIFLMTEREFKKKLRQEFEKPENGGWMWKTPRFKWPEH